MITVQFLGGASLRSGDVPLGGPPTQRHRIALLTLVVAAWPQPVSRDRAMALLWPERDLPNGRRLLNLAVHVLRTALGDDAIASTPDGLLFDPLHVRCDLHELRVAMNERAHDRVVQVYAGPLLDGFHLSESTEFGYWLDERRAEFSHAYVGALLALAGQQEQSGDVHAWVGTCRRLVTVDPYSAVHALALMNALDAAGDRTGAIQHASEYAQRLRADHELDPDPDVAALAARLRVEPSRPKQRSANLTATLTSTLTPTLTSTLTATPTAPLTAPLEPPLAPPSESPFESPLESPLESKLESPLESLSAPQSARRVIAALALLSLLAIGVYAAQRWRRPAELPMASAAVLPFADLSPAHDQEYFSDGLTDELITTLSKVPGLSVAARTSSFQFKGRNPDVRDIGRRLGVGAVIEGSVRRSGSRLRVSAELIDTRNGNRLWSESYDREASDIFAVQEDLARSIVAALRVRLAPARDSALAVRPTRDLEAYDLYLKGLFTWNQRTPLSLGDAVRYLEQAVARDSAFTRAWAALADAYLLQYPYGAGGSHVDNWQKAQVAANRALALDPGSGEAYTALGYGNTIYAWDFVAAEANFKRAIAVNPSYATGHHWYGDFLAGRGRLAESREQFEIASRLDPLSRQIGTESGWVLYLMRQNDAASARIQETLKLDPNYAQAHLRLGLVEIQQHRYPEAIASLNRSIVLGVFFPHAAAGLARAYAASGDRAAALKVVNDLLKRRSAGEFIPPFAIAAGYLGLADTTQGITWLNRGIDEKDIYLPENFFEPLLDPLRISPRFAPVLARVGIERPPR